MADILAQAQSLPGNQAHEQPVVPHLVIQIEVQVVAQQQVEQRLLAVLIVPQCGCPLQRQQGAAHERCGLWAKTFQTV